MCVCIYIYIYTHKVSERRERGRAGMGRASSRLSPRRGYLSCLTSSRCTSFKTCLQPSFTRAKQKMTGTNNSNNTIPFTRAPFPFFRKRAPRRTPACVRARALAGAVADATRPTRRALVVLEGAKGVPRNGGSQVTMRSLFPTRRPAHFLVRSFPGKLGHPTSPPFGINNTYKLKTTHKHKHGITSTSPFGIPRSAPAPRCRSACPTPSRGATPASARQGTTRSYYCYCYQYCNCYYHCYYY